MESKTEKNILLNHCAICAKKFNRDDLTPLSLVRTSLRPFLKIEILPENQPPFICNADLNVARNAHFNEILLEEKKELNTVERDLSKALLQNELLSSDLSKGIGPLKFGEKLSDYMAKKGGSWGFLLGFLICLIFWVCLNLLTINALDPFPFIFLNLILSCIAAIQAPIIMMSQNRSASYDRRRAEQDYKVNIKSEIEIRILNEKVDRLISHQWQRLLEMQEIQLDLLNNQVGLKK